ncbi:hypothetical protein LP419_38420 [Massilia sp. H-1]|nr:hypothetical protein LP419_38420 [Massilia sp. H-1]
MTELLGTLGVGDATLRTRILHTISGRFADVNKLRAQARQRRKQLAQGEIGGRIRGPVPAVRPVGRQRARASRCARAVRRIAYPPAGPAGRTRSPILGAGRLPNRNCHQARIGGGSARRAQAGTLGRAQRVQAIAEAARRILDGVPKRIAQCADGPQMEAYFAADALLGKLRASMAELRKLGNEVGADELVSRLKALRRTGPARCCDSGKLVTGNTIRLGRHAFTVNAQALDLSIVVHQGQPAYHLTGTDYFAPVADAALDALAPYWQQDSVAESARVPGRIPGRPDRGRGPPRRGRVELARPWSRRWLKRRPGAAGRGRAPLRRTPFSRWLPEGRARPRRSAHPAPAGAADRKRLACCVSAPWRAWPCCTGATPAPRRACRRAPRRCATRPCRPS